MKFSVSEIYRHALKAKTRGEFYSDWGCVYIQYRWPCTYAYENLSTCVCQIFQRLPSYDLIKGTLRKLLFLGKETFLIKKYYLVAALLHCNCIPT